MDRMFVLDLGLFEPRCGSVFWSEAITFDLLEILARANQQVLRCGRIPSIYSSGVRYIKEPPEREIFMAIPAIMRDGGADCEDLSAWLVAECRSRGENAQFVLRKMKILEKTKRADGKTFFTVRNEVMIGSADRRTSPETVIIVPHGDEMDDMNKGALLYHVQVMRANGQIEDPSAILGMGRKNKGAA